MSEETVPGNRGCRVSVRSIPYRVSVHSIPYIQSQCAFNTVQTELQVKASLLERSQGASMQFAEGWKGEQSPAHSPLPNLKGAPLHL